MTKLEASNMVEKSLIEILLRTLCGLIVRIFPWVQPELVSQPSWAGIPALIDVNLNEDLRMILSIPRPRDLSDEPNQCRLTLYNEEGTLLFDESLDLQIPSDLIGGLSCIRGLYESLSGSSIPKAADLIQINK